MQTMADVGGSAPTLHTREAATDTVAGFLDAAGFAQHAEDTRSVLLHDAGPDPRNVE